MKFIYSVVLPPVLDTNRKKEKRKKKKIINKTYIIVKSDYFLDCCSQKLISKKYKYLKMVMFFYIFIKRYIEQYKPYLFAYYTAYLWTFSTTHVKMSKAKKYITWIVCTYMLKDIILHQYNSCITIFSKISAKTKIIITKFINWWYIFRRYWISILAIMLFETMNYNMIIIY